MFLKCVSHGSHQYGNVEEGEVGMSNCFPHVGGWAGLSLLPLNVKSITGLFFFKTPTKFPNSVFCANTTTSIWSSPYPAWGSCRPVKSSQSCCTTFQVKDQRPLIFNPTLSDKAKFVLTFCLQTLAVSARLFSLLLIRQECVWFDGGQLLEGPLLFNCTVIFPLPWRLPESGPGVNKPYRH